MQTHYKKSIIASVIGNILEWYDFTVFAFLAPVLGRLFFPADNKVTALINVFAIFAISYLIRPLGGVIFGHFGDRVGRSRILRISIFAMTIPTVLVGMIPIYSQAGMIAPLILLGLRIMQGISAGGELIGSTVYIYEVSPNNQKGYWCSFVTASSIGGVLLGSIAITIIHSIIPIDALMNWGWRIPFYFGGLLGVIGLWMRKRLVASLLFANIRENSKIHKYPLVVAIKKHYLKIAQVIMINIFVSVAFYLLFVWMPSYINVFLSGSTLYSLVSSTVVMLLLITLIPVIGKFSDHIGRKRIALSSVFAICVFAYPLFMLIIHGDIFLKTLALLLFALCMSGIEGVLSVIMAELFITEIRYSGIAVGYNLATSIFGGTAPILCTFLVSKTSSMAAPALYLIIVGIVSLPALFLLPTKIHA